MVTIENCRFCGKSHGVRCPDVKAIEYAEDGVTIRRVEFVTTADFLAPIQPMPMPTGPVTWSPQRWPNTSGGSLAVKSDGHMLYNQGSA
jgi:hypothetical protein